MPEANIKYYTPEAPLSDAEGVALKNLALAALRDWVEAELSSGKPVWMLMQEMQAAIVETFGQ